MKTEPRQQTVTAVPHKPFSLSNTGLKPVSEILTNRGKITGALV